MIANELRPGDAFVCHSQAEWDAMSASERKRTRVAVLERRLGSCITYDRIHLRTSAGTWCIPKEAPVVLVTVEKAKNNPSARARRPAGRAAA